MDSQQRIIDHLTFLYGPAEAASLWPRIEMRLGQFRDRMAARAQNPGESRLSQRDAILITYGDQIHEPGRAPLASLAAFGERYLDGVVSAIHLLPFYPYSSDDGFSVINYRRVHPEMGDWPDVERLGERFGLMFDAVINHISRQSAWFQGYLRGEAPYSDYFITVDPSLDLSNVVRPRALPLLTAVETAQGTKHVWTTFSEDQIDLNYACPEVMFEIIDLLLFYAERGARLIRLDAIAYMWKEIGTPCIHLPQVHRAVKLFRDVFVAAAALTGRPEVAMITETNVPHEENISYFGDPTPDGTATDEAQLVYQFPLPPLLMHSLLTGNARALSEWTAGLVQPPNTTFFNFCASHDGVGVMPARGLLTPDEIQALADAALAHGGRVSYKANSDGSQSVYELNISYFDALSDPAADEPLEIQVRRFVVSQAIMLALAGVPGIYVHSLLGSRSWQEGVAETGRNRTINRQKFDRARLETELADPGSLRSQVYTAYRTLLRARAVEPAFDPYGEQRVLDVGAGVFALLRLAPEGGAPVLCLHNVSDQTQTVRLGVSEIGSRLGVWVDLLTGEEQSGNGAGLVCTLSPYAVRWLKPLG
jgi:sucrose phosphorylase